MESVELNGTGKIAAALAKAQAEMSNPKFDSQNPHFRNRFASLASVRNAVVPVLAKHGIAMVQDLMTTEDGKGVSCTTILCHESGERLVFGPLVIPAAKPDAWGLGSASTYAKRYSMSAVCGVVGDDDDDASAASGKQDPMDRENLSPNIEHAKYAQAFRAAKTPEEVKRVHEDCLAEGEEFYRSVWRLLDSKVRSRTKEALSEAA